MLTTAIRGIEAGQDVLREHHRVTHRGEVVPGGAMRYYDMLVLFETDGMLASSVEVDVTTVEDQWRALAKVRGELYDGDRHELLHDIKAATYHTLEVRPDEGWARVLFDI